MQTNEKWLDDMQVKLSAVCKAYNWGLKQTSAWAAGTRSFAVKHGSKSITVLISRLISTRIEADVILEHDDVEYERPDTHSPRAEVTVKGPTHPWQPKAPFGSSCRSTSEAGHGPSSRNLEHLAYRFRASKKSVNACSSYPVARERHAVLR
jgi:hypothetical protein